MRTEIEAARKRLLEKYSAGKERDEMTALLGAPDPFDGGLAHEILEAGGAPAEELRKKRRLWKEVNRPPEEKPSSVSKKAPLPPRLQLTAWIVAPDTSSASTPRRRRLPTDMARSSPLM